MQEMNQGEEYEEQGFEDEAYEYEDEAEENTKAGFDTFWGIPRKTFFIGVAVAVIVLLAVMLIFAKFGMSSSESTDDIYIPPEDAGTVDSGTDTAVTTTQCYDANGNLLGTCDGLTDGFSIYDESYNDIGYIDSSGSQTFYDSAGNVLGTYEPASTSPDAVTNDSIETTTTSSDDVELLRKMGYTGDEIELAQSTGVDTDTLVEAAEKLHDEAAKEALERMSDSASEEFQYIVNNSIFCLPEITFDEFDDSQEQSRLYTGEYVVNADYEKVPTYGNQLWIKVKIANNTYAFYLVTPERWATLPEAGNIVMRVQYTMYGTNNVNMYITGLQEVDTTQITVNPEDSASELSDILSDYSDQYTDDEDSTEDTEQQVNWW